MTTKPRCLNGIECYLENFTAIVQTGAVAGTLDFVADPAQCRMSTDHCIIRALLARAAAAYLDANGGSSDELKDASACSGYYSDCMALSANAAYFAKAKTLTVTTAVAGPAAAQTATFPIKCDGATITFA